VAREGIKGFAGHPLIFRGEVVGVLAVFSRKPVLTQQFQWLRLFADQAAVAIANAKAFEEIENLRQRLELENEYLRAEVKETLVVLLERVQLFGKFSNRLIWLAPVEANVFDHWGIWNRKRTGRSRYSRTQQA